MKQASVKELHSELGMHSVRLPEEEQGRRKQQQVLIQMGRGPKEARRT